MNKLFASPFLGGRSPEGRGGESHSRGDYKFEIMAFSKTSLWPSPSALYDRAPPPYDGEA
jgi:hypothetical protein